MKKTIKIATLMLSILFFLNSNDTIAQCHNDDWIALKTLYESTNGDNWTTRTGWSELIDNQNSPPQNCNLNTLFGVAVEYGRVTHINMDMEGRPKHLFGDTIGNNLDGILPPEIDKLDHLKSLFIFHNNLSGSLPLELFNLSNLEYLGLRGNQLEGAISSQIGNLQNLKKIYIDRNNFSGNIPQELGTLSNLLRCRMSKNAFTGSIPSEIGNLSNLETLGLAENQLSGDIPIELYNLTKLTHLWLFKNQLTGTISPEIGELNDLTHFSIFDNLISGLIPPEIGSLSNLTWLSLARNELTGNLPIELGYLTNLTLLEIPGNNLYGCFPNNFTSYCTQLTDPEFNANYDIDSGNNFDATWEDFCATEAGACCLSNCETDIYPGDLNHDGIVDHIDFVLIDSYLYNSNIPKARASEHQNTEWYPHPAEDWGILQHNNEDLKHHDCNGDGIIDESDYEAVGENWEREWMDEPILPTPPPESDYQVRFYPIEELNTDFLRMNVALENVTGNDLELDRAYFTIKYDDLANNVNSATFNFGEFPWIGVPGINLETTVDRYPSNKEIKVGFKRTDGMNSVGNGIIGQLILQLSGANNARLNSDACLINFEAVNVGTIKNSTQATRLKNQQLQVNLCEGTCQTNWYIDETQFQNEFKSTDLIETDGPLIIGELQQVEYQSNRVCLRSGFIVKAGATFKAGYGICN